MLFGLFFDRKSINGVVGVDHQIYWSTASVAVFFGYTAVSNFTARNFTHTLTDIIPPNVVNQFSVHIQRMKLICHSALISTLMRSTKLIDVGVFEQLESFNFYIKVERVSRNLFRNIFVCEETDEDAIPFKKWIEKYTFEEMPATTTATPILEALLLAPVEHGQFRPRSPDYPPPTLSPIAINSPDHDGYVESDDGQTVETPGWMGCGYSPVSPPYVPNMPDLSPNFPPPTLSPFCAHHSPSADPESPPEVKTEPVENLQPEESQVHSSDPPGHTPAASSPGFTMWFDSFPPTRIYFFDGNQPRIFFEQ